MPMTDQDGGWEVRLFLVRQTGTRHRCFKYGNMPKTGGGLISPHLCKLSYDIHLILLTQRRGCEEQRYLAGSMPLLTPATVLRHVVVPRLSPLPPFFMKCGGRSSSGGRAGTLHPENSLGVSSPCLPQPQ